MERRQGAFLSRKDESHMLEFWKKHNSVFYLNTKKVIRRQIIQGFPQSEDILRKILKIGVFGHVLFFGGEMEMENCHLYDSRISGTINSMYEHLCIWMKLVLM